MALVSRQNKTMDSLLERGEKLDDLVAKSEHLGSQSKAFYKTVSAALGLLMLWSSLVSFGMLGPSSFLFTS